ncbi:MAG TPA: septal ring lytic transglycosylase RlpA family protein [Myxococcaceae bacterium]|nr:septal ring lytic transglycosylase RlpA family protein [Myxococcaceae bacterium]
MRARRLLILAALGLAGCPRPPGPPRGGGEIARGTASYYSNSLHGRPTASGERYDRGDLTAAHRSLAFGTCVVVVNADNGRSVRVRVNDRGPYAKERLIDVSEAAARELGMLREGVARVRLYRC